MRQERARPSDGFRTNLIRAMARRGLTHDKMATALEDVGVRRSREAITAWVNGRGEPDLDLLPKVAQALNVPIADLIEGYLEQPGPTPEEVLAQAVARELPQLVGGMLSDEQLEKLATKIAEQLIDKLAAKIAEHLARSPSPDRDSTAKR